MYKSITEDIKKIYLDQSVHKLHKTGEVNSDFGMDTSAELLDNGFGLYSTSGLVKKIGPLKAQYYRFSLVRRGSVSIDLGIESYKVTRNYIISGFPGQIFSLYNPEDFTAYYMLFTEDFLSDIISPKKLQQFPFLSYEGNHCFELKEETAIEIEQVIMKMNDELKKRKPALSNVIKSYIQLILIFANRDYNSLLLSSKQSPAKSLFVRYIKLVSQHFLLHRKVTYYADMLYVSADHLNRVIKKESGKTAGELINDMILIEAKAYLMHSDLSAAEIAYKLGFSDPSSFSKFFKGAEGITPLQFRTSE
jgi:AraC family transcriptional regulator, transcriptional activator of pobA